MKSILCTVCLVCLISHMSKAAETSAQLPERHPAAEKNETEIAAVDLGPEQDAQEQGGYRKPPGPVQGGVLKVPHPGAAKGLLRINKDGSYQYRTAIRPKSQAVSVRVMSMAAPTIEGPNGATFKSIYGSGNLYTLAVDYEWAPIRSFGALGLQFGTGFATAHGNGVLANYGGAPSQETYNLYIVPLSAFAIYRFEYVRRQWIVPFVNGGITYYGMAEKRDDDKPMKFAGAPAVGGGGGFHFSISRLDPAKAFIMDREYGIADMWLTVEARAMKGLYQETDFTSSMLSLGVTMDF